MSDLQVEHHRIHSEYIIKYIKFQKLNNSNHEGHDFMINQPQMNLKVDLHLKL